MRIHKRRGSRFPAAAGLIFISLCAYLMSWLYGLVNRDYELQTVREISLRESLSLEGIALRRELPLSRRQAGYPLPPEAQRLPAGTELGRDEEGRPLLSPASALFYPVCDGLERLAPEDGEVLSVTGLEGLLQEKPRRRPGLAGKLVLGQYWYFAALCRASALSPCSCSLQLEGEEESREARLIYVSPPLQGRQAVLLRLPLQYGEELRRSCSARLILNQYSGLQLPEKAVRRDAGGNEFVYTLTAGRPERKAVEIIYSSGELCIAAFSPEVRALREGDLLILSEINTD